MPSFINLTEKKRSTRSYLFTSESVSAGHPDKLADRISDTILDRFLEADPQAKVACETLIAADLVVIAGEFHTNPPELFSAIREKFPMIVRRVIREVGYDSSFPGIDPEGCEIRLQVNVQSADIRQGVEQGEGNIGAGDQGLMFGHACDETPELMPLPISLAHRLMVRQAELRQSGELPWLRPDAKSQVTVRYSSEHPVAVETVVLSTQHDEEVDQASLREAVIERIIRAVIPAEMLTTASRFLVNPTGRFVIGGPCGDTGLTGRKIIVDTYGGRCPHGGGAFSGKDPSKVDRSGAYAARYVAKNIVAAGLAKSCTIQLAYAIGIAEPVSLLVDSHGTGITKDHLIEEAVRKIFDLTPAGIIRELQLQRPIYAATATYGHFGREGLGFGWERTDRAAELRAAVQRTAK
jgi:S-adenosylmethionine synthetase